MDDDDLLRTLLHWTRQGLLPCQVWPFLACMAVPIGCEHLITWGCVFDLMRTWQKDFEPVSLRRVA